METQNKASLKAEKNGQKTIIVCRELFSLATVLASAYEMQEEAYFDFRTKKNQIEVSLVHLKKKEAEKEVVEKKFFNNLVKFSWYELNLANKIALRWLNNKQYYYYFDYAQSPEDFFDEEYLNGSERTQQEEPKKEDVSNEQDTDMAPSSQDIETQESNRYDDNAEIDDVDDFDKIIIDDPSGISVPWEVKHGETRNKK